MFKEYNYLCDTHTAVAVKVYEDYVKQTVFDNTYNTVKTAYNELRTYTYTNVDRLDDKINGLLASKDAFIFKGTITPSTNKNGTPTWEHLDHAGQTNWTCESAGETFKVASTGYLWGDFKVFAGNMVIAKKDGANPSTKADWIVVSTHV